MKENLRTTHYADGTAVNNASSIGYSTISETDSYYYDYLFDTANSALYGRLYTWPAAVNDTIGSSLTPSGIQGICPAGWHLPSDNEWKILEGTADTQYGVNHIAWNYSEGRGHDAGHRLKSEYGWNWGGGGNNLFFFSAKPSGRKSHGNNFNNLGNGAYFWSSTTVSFSDAFSRNFSAADIAYRYGMHKGNGFSVRCLKD